MLTKLTALVAAGVTALTLITTTAPGAGASTRGPSRVVLRDGPGDVWRETEPGSNEYEPARKPQADVTRAVVRYGHYVVTMRMWFVNLRRVGAAANYVFLIETGRRRYMTTLFVDDGGPGGWQGWQGYIYHGGGSPDWNCARETHHIDYANDVVTVKVPRACLGRPAWVRVRLSNAFYTVKWDGYFDQPHNHRAFAHAWTPRVYRG